MERYRKLALAEWRKLKPLTGAAGKPADYEESHRRRGITHIMQTLAQGGDLHEELWLKLADKRAEQHPDDAIRIYRHQVESAVGQTNKEGYSVAVRYLEKIKTLMAQSGREQAFSSYLETLRTTHKRKRSFIAMIEEL